MVVTGYHTKYQQSGGKHLAVCKDKHWQKSAYFQFTNKVSDCVAELLLWLRACCSPRFASLSEPGHPGAGMYPCFPIWLLTHALILLIALTQLSTTTSHLKFYLENHLVPDATRLASPLQLLGLELYVILHSGCALRSYAECFQNTWPSPYSLYSESRGWNVGICVIFKASYAIFIRGQNREAQYNMGSFHYFN